MDKRPLTKGKKMKTAIKYRTSATDLVPLILTIAAALLLLLSQASGANTHFNFDGCNFVTASNTGAVTLELNDVKVFAAR